MIMGQYAEKITGLDDDALSLELWKVINEKSDAQMKLDVIYLEAERRERAQRENKDKIRRSKEVRI